MRKFPVNFFPGSGFGGSIPGTNHVIIVAAGSGTRMNAGLPKQFILLAGKPLLMHTIGKFHDADPAMEIVVVLPAGEIEQWKALCAKFDFHVKHQVVVGGESRYQSVKNGLALVKGDGITGVHDGARPLVSAPLIIKCFQEAANKGNAVPCIPVKDSLRQLKDEGNVIADRSAFVSIQTPQCFSIAVLRQAYESGYKKEFTDDASVVEASGYKINLVNGESENIKITFPEDLLLAEVLLSKTPSEKGR